MNELIDRFVEDLRNVSVDNVFNPYSQHCAVHDCMGAPDLRCINIKSVLTACSSVPAVDIWIGRDLGHRGGRRTGIALADEFHLESYARYLKLPALRKSTRSAAIKEQTAACVFQAMSLSDVPVLTWNVFPFHPFDEGDDFSNRCHSKLEAAVGIEFLNRLISMFKVRQIIAIGSDAAKATNAVGKGSVPVRHPSYGGKNVFLDQMKHIYKSKIIERDQFELSV